MNLFTGITFMIVMTLVACCIPALNRFDKWASAKIADFKQARRDAKVYRGDERQ